jgi:hypothetical protein
MMRANHFLIAHAPKAEANYEGSRHLTAKADLFDGVLFIATGGLVRQACASHSHGTATPTKI